jgi:DNA-binding CsgD family transcriptional regulator/tetratricopeptide (TPR) repeat protein
MTETVHSAAQLGRRSQVEQVCGYIADLAAGKGRALLVEGEPGIGKSELMRTAGLEAVSLGCQVLWCTCEELSQDFPLLPLMDAFAPRGGLARYADAHARIAGLLREAAVPGNQVDCVGAAATSLLDLVADVCGVAPVLLVVDDLHWADPATVVALGQFFRSTRRLPLMVAGLARPAPRRDDLAALRRAVDPAAQLTLSGLSEDEVIDLVAQAVGGTPGERLRRLAAEAAGNPLYVRELIDAVARTGTITVDGGQVEIIGGRPPASLPAAIADRLEFLSTPVREVLRAAALLGVAFPVSGLASVSGQRITDLMPVLDEAIAMGVLHEHGSELAFRHPLIRAALYQGMAATVRAAWHLDAAKALAGAGAPAEKVARQILAAVDGGATTVDEWLVGWLADAANRLAGQAPNATVRLLRWALGGTRPGVDPHDLLACRLADALWRTGDTVAAARAATGALAHIKHPELIVDLNATLVACLAFDGKREEGLQAIDAALGLPGLEPGHQARLLVLAARIHRSLGRVDRTEQVAEEALAVATAAGDRWATGWALGMLTLVHGMRGDEEAALPLFERALAVAEGDPSLADLRLMLLLNKAAALGDLDRYDEAIRAAEQAFDRADTTGNMVRMAQAKSVLGELLFDVGRWDEALERVDLGSAGTGDPFVECNDHGVAAVIRLHRGDPAAAQDLVDAQLYTTRLGERLVGPLMVARSLDREQADEPAEALAILVEALARCTEEVEQSSDLLADAVRLAVQVGDLDRAHALAERAEEGAGTSEIPHRRAVVLHCRGLIKQDSDLLVEAAGLYERAGRPLARAQALEAAGMVCADCDEIGPARTHFTDAYAIYSDLGAEWDVARLQARFRAFGIRRGPRFQHRRSHQGWGSLTPTEVKVVGLVAQGMSNPQIAEKLFLSRRTVQTHVSHVLTKLELHSRTEIAREASRRGM